jgi:hypothetical protein
MLRLPVLLILLAVYAQAATSYCIDGATGDDAQAGTVEKPWKSLAKAAATLQAGETVLLRGGTYLLTEQVHPKNSGTKDAPITFANYQQEEVIINGGPGTCFTLQGSAYIAFRGLRMTTLSEKTGASMVYMEASDGCSFTDCEFFGMPAPNGRENSAVIRCTRTGNGFSKDGVVRNCLFRDNRSPALRLYTTKGWIIENNEFRDCLEAVGGKDQPYDMVVRRNMIVGGSLAFYFAGQGGCGNVSITENLVIGAGQGFMIGGLGTGGNKRADVRLVNNTFVECVHFICGWDDGFTTGQVYANNIFHSTKAVNIPGGSDTAGRLLNLNKYGKKPADAANYLMDWNCLSIPQEDTSTWFINASLRANGIAAWTTAHPPFEQHSISTDPGFVDPAKGDYHLTAGSPCKGKGRNGEDLGAYPHGDDGTIIGRVIMKR